RVPKPSEKTVWSTVGATDGGPDERTRLTAVPADACVLPAGLWLITLPAATVVLDWFVSAPTTRLAPVIWDSAVACGWPRMLGTVTPDERMRSTVLASGAWVPPVGLWLITWPIGAV